MLLNLLLVLDLLLLLIVKLPVDVKQYQEETKRLEEE